MEIATAIRKADERATVYLAGEPVVIDSLRWHADTGVWMATVTGDRHEHVWVGVDDLSSRPSR